MMVGWRLSAAWLALTPAALAAQSIVVSAGVGSGSASFSCDGCASRRDNAVAALLRAGVVVHPQLTIAAEASGWWGDFKDARGTGSMRMTFATAVAQWHPVPTSGAFVKAGAGAAWIRDELRVTQTGNATVTTSGPAFVVGAGWDLHVVRHASITPYADFDVAAKREQTINSVRDEGRFGGTLLHVGVALTFRSRQ